MANFFASHGTVWYTMADGTQVTVNDLTTFANFNLDWKTNPNYQMEYQIKDGDLPHILSNRLYDSVEFWWTILLINDISNVEQQWPMTYETLNQYIDNKYPSDNRYDVHHYIDSNGLIVDLLSQRIKYSVNTDQLAIEYGGLEAVSIEEYETAVNENKRNIVLIDPDFITLVKREFDDQMSSDV